MLLIITLIFSLNGDKRSVMAQLYEGVFTLIEFDEMIHSDYLNPPRSSELIPTDLDTDYEVTQTSIESSPLITLAQKGATPHQHILFLHGGSYQFEINSLYWSFVKRLVDEANLRVTLLLYPLAPEANYNTTNSIALQAYKWLDTNYPNDNLILMGDSAGGGLTLSLAQQLESEKMRLPKQLILLSPWLDLSLSDSETIEYDKVDPMLSIKSLTISAQRYANGVTLTDPKLSPIYGEQSSVPTHIFYSTTELFYPQIRRYLASSSQAKGYAYEGMLHDWMIFPMRESDEVIARIKSIINPKEQE
jgi:monoterpene epsilon-lactone hydrolase